MRKISVITAAMMAISVILAGCSSTTDSADDMEVYSGSSAYDQGGGEYYEDEVDDDGDSETAAQDITGAGLSDFEISDRKLIKHVDLAVETKEFDQFLEAVREKISYLEGYVQSSSISGNSYEYSDGMRYGYLVARIPAEQMDQFVAQVKAAGNVTSINEDVQDVTESYVDTQSRKKTLEASQESLLKLLESADSVEAIVTLETRLTEVRLELESLEARLRSYDNQIAYSTIYMDIMEVARVTETVSESMGDEIRNRLSDNLYDIGQGARRLTVAVIGSLPYLVPLAVVGIAAVLIVKRQRKKRSQKLAE